MKFKKGDRVTFLGSPQLGTVLGYSILRSGTTVVVVWDGSTGWEACNATTLRRVSGLDMATRKIK